MTHITTCVPARPAIEAHWLAFAVALLLLGIPALSAPPAPGAAFDWHGNVASGQP